MLDRLTANLQFQAQALSLRAERQRVLAGNIANADTPGFQARDFDFAKALSAAGAGASLPRSTTVTDTRHLKVAAGGAQAGGADLVYRLPEQARLDGNTVDMDRERANFADNSVRYEATLRFINGNVRTILSAIRGE
ncbi:MAG: flagellar basal body rod protein FlgB [Burkholderiaceae bacterium]|nr:flagellar basal body rod protein FlgB [Burkholderiaceae bacterium]